MELSLSFVLLQEIHFHESPAFTDRFVPCFARVTLPVLQLPRQLFCVL